MQDNNGVLVVDRCRDLSKVWYGGEGCDLHGLWLVLLESTKNLLFVVDPLRTACATMLCGSVRQGRVFRVPWNCMVEKGISYTWNYKVQAEYFVYSRLHCAGDL
jgi:hypothetical protein